MVDVSRRDFLFEKREYPRVKDSCVLRFRKALLPEDAPITDFHWDASLSKNISRKGVLFHSSYQYQPGDILEMTIKISRLDKEMVCFCRVIRSGYPTGTRIFCLTAVCIEKIERGMEEPFVRAIDAMIRKN